MGENGKYILGEILKKRREDLNIGVRELCRNIDKSALAGKHRVSPSYYSQVENAAGIRPEKTTMDFFWAVSTALDLDPMELFLASRPNIPKDLADGFLKQLLVKNCIPPNLPLKSKANRLFNQFFLAGS
jgi:hypothetical protein